jgi:alpha-ketoglutarate-dependent taurine dioxygenase
LRQLPLAHACAAARRAARAALSQQRQRGGAPPPPLRRTPPPCDAAARCAASMAHAQPYTLSPLPGCAWGAEVRGLQLSEASSDAHVASIRADVLRHRLLVFRDQGVVPAARQAAFAARFGPLESTFFKHPRSAHPDVFRVSNDPAEGCTGVGRTGWHVDGSFCAAPFAFALYHIVSVAPAAGATAFVPLRELYERAPAAAQARWRRAWMVSDRRGGPMHPLVYAHPETGDTTLCFHTGMTAAVVWDADDAAARRLATDEEAAALLRELGDACDASPLRYEHVWRHGDFIVSDNRAVAHEATAATQAPRQQVGLRVMHRCTVAGSEPPRKRAAAGGA